MMLLQEKSLPNAYQVGQYIQGHDQGEGEPHYQEREREERYNKNGRGRGRDGASSPLRENVQSLPYH